MRVKNHEVIYGSIEYRFSSSPSQGGEMGSTPIGAKACLNSIAMRKSSNTQSTAKKLIKKKRN